MKLLHWLIGVLKDKLNVLATFREILKLGKRFGLRFVIAAIVWESIEDVLLPMIAWHFGHPELIPIFLVLHFEPVIYPVFLFCFKTYDRMRGREPWDPNRPWVSTNIRSWLKVTSNQLLSLTLFWLILTRIGLPLWLLVAYFLTMLGFKFVYERIWHDSSWGITPGDRVQIKRVVLKIILYRVVSVAVMGMVLRGFLGAWHVWALLTYQGAALVVHSATEALWARSDWGIRPSKTCDGCKGDCEGCQRAS